MDVIIDKCSKSWYKLGPFLFIFLFKIYIIIVISYTKEHILTYDTERTLY